MQNICLFFSSCSFLVRQKEDQVGGITGVKEAKEQCLVTGNKNSKFLGCYCLLDTSISSIVESTIFIRKHICLSIGALVLDRNAFLKIHEFIS